ncbi:FKBP12-associated protein 1-like protein [Phlyctema vagabunda]|uniref:FKBP12-associated protein 1-like protein n=1 Tax=Phlyctema vagabunda TaxID=108571 RepID=A0ABR4PKS1_9HELO
MSSYASPEPPAYSSRNSSNASISDPANADLESGVVESENSFPLEDLSAGPGPSQASELSVRIYEDIVSNVYDCPICNEKISFNKPLWSCNHCSQVYHFSCIKQWSVTSSNTGTWSCPTCKISHVALGPKATCWCKFCEYDSPTVQHNSCGRFCTSYQRCKYQAKCTTFCHKQCHPGPCTQPYCLPDCSAISSPEGASSRITELPQAHVRNNSAGPDPPVVVNARFHATDTEATTAPNFTDASQSNQAQNTVAPQDTPYISQNSRRQGTTTDPRPTREGLFKRASWHELNASLFMLVVLEGILILWCHLEVKWKTQPLEHRVSTERESHSGWWWMVAVSSCGNPILGFCLMSALNELVYRLKEASERPDLAACKRVFLCSVREFTLVISVLGFFPSFLWFPIAWHVAPQYAFKHQMAKTCKGFDTKVNLGSVMDRSANPILRYTGESWSGISMPHLKPPGNSFATGKQRYNGEKDLSHVFYRLTVPMTTKYHLAVDIDTPDHAWRISQVPQEEAVLMIAAAKDKPYGTHILNSRDDERLLRNGTWAFENHDVVIPDLDLVMPNMDLFLERAEYQPFVAAFRTTNRTAAAVEEQSRRKWTASSADNVVMRTSSFGMGMHDLEVCARRHDFVTRDNVVQAGLGDETLVPLALLAVFRHETSSRGKGFKYGSIRPATSL